LREDKQYEKGIAIAESISDEKFKSTLKRCVCAKSPILAYLKMKKSINDSHHKILNELFLPQDGE